jgi:ubiquinone/menaquinone biosynthesis C-methylase UbiE
MDKVLQDKFEHHYLSSSEPWDYSASGAEKLRFKRVMALARQFAPKPDQVLDVGCSLGQFTVLMAGYANTTWAIDISPTAVRLCQENIGHQVKGIEFLVSTLAEVDLPPSSLDVIFYCDGINSHEITGDALTATIEKTRLLLKPGGIIIFTDYLHYRHFDHLRAKVASFGLNIIHDEPMNDKLWFHVKSWLKKGQNFSWVKQVLASETAAARFAKISALRGEKGSRHLCIVAQK